MNKIKVKKLCKTIKDNVILDSVEFELEAGKIYGFIGKNGSGKSMLFKIIAGLVKPSSGRIFIDDKELYKDMDYIEKLGIVIENKGMYDDLTGFENLKYLASINSYIGDEEIKKSMERVGLDSNDKKYVKKYSLGMRQKIIIAQAIMEKPELLLLDEPTNALDDKSVEKLRNIVREEAKRGAIVMISSHNKEDIEVLCDKVYTIKEGKLC